jgi:isocitrate dehydrogenase
MTKLPESQAEIKVKTRSINGIDLFLEAQNDIENMAKKLDLAAAPSNMKLKLISNRGVKVFPNDHGTESDLTDCFRCRFIAKGDNRDISNADIMQLVTNVAKDYPWMHIEKLSMFDGVPGYSKAHGED